MKNNFEISKKDFTCVIICVLSVFVSGLVCEHSSKLSTQLERKFECNKSCFDVWSVKKNLCVSLSLLCVFTISHEEKWMANLNKFSHYLNIFKSFYFYFSQKIYWNGNSNEKFLLYLLFLVKLHCKFFKFIII